MTIDFPTSDERWNLLYVFEERHPQDLRKLVYESLPQEHFVVERMTYLTPDDEKITKLRWAHLVMFAPGRFLADELFPHAEHIRLMQLWSSGYDKFNVAAAARYGIPVANNGGANRIAVAEHAILLMLAVYKKLPEAHARTVEGRWGGNSHGMDMFLLYRKTLGLIGLGAIGRAVAERARGFGMRILYFDINRASPEVEAKLGVEFRDLDEVICQSDILSPHLHLDQNTFNMIGRDQIAKMKPRAVIINVSRGELVDTGALYEALIAGRLGGAGFDVYAKEPTEPGDPLLNHPSVVCTPHMACTYDTHVMAMEASVENLLRVKNGGQPLWVVNGVKAKAAS
jgi:phosphoglycerate dehydrogenase-like enzyme